MFYFVSNLFVAFYDYQQLIKHIKILNNYFLQISWRSADKELSLYRKVKYV